MGTRLTGRLGRMALATSALLITLQGCDNETPRASSRPSGTPESARVVEHKTAPEFDADSAYAYIARQVEFGPRVPNSPAHASCGDWLAAELNRHGAEVIIKSASEVVYHSIREDLEKLGVVFTDMDTGLREYPEI
ncbi:MAG: hypothetical protein ACO2ZL_01845, partial [Flavobacteriales bacterium]